MVEHRTENPGVESSILSPGTTPTCTLYECTSWCGAQAPNDFILLGESENCKIQAMKHKNKPFYGLQFHPEVEHTEFGEKIFRNFVKICEK